MKNINYNIRLVITPSGKLRLGFVQFLSKPRIEKSGPFKGCKGQEWKYAPEKIRAKLANQIGATLLKGKGKR